MKIDGRYYVACIPVHANQNQYVPTRTVTKPPIDKNSVPGPGEPRQAGKILPPHLEAIVPCIEDWHAKVILIETIKL